MTTIRKFHPVKENGRQPPQDSDLLWRYVPLQTLFCYLSGSIFIPSLKTLHQGDPFESDCLFDPSRFDAAIKEQHQTQADEVQNHLSSEKKDPMECYFRFLRETRYAWCWFCQDHESAAMWNTYGHNGAAIRTSVGKLRSVLEHCGHNFAFGPMLYIRVLPRSIAQKLFPENVPDRPFLLEPCFLKRFEYESEKEVRFVTTETESSEEGIFLKAKKPSDEIKPADWIEHIRLSPRLRSSEEEALTKAIKALHPTVESCQRSDLLSNRSEPASFSSVTKMCEESWEKGWDGIPAPLKKLLL